MSPWTGGRCAAGPWKSREEPGEGVAEVTRGSVERGVVVDWPGLRGRACNGTAGEAISEVVPGNENWCEVVEPREASGEQGVGADAELTCGYPNGEGARVRLVEVETGGDGQPSGEDFGNNVGKMLAHQPAIVRGVTRDLPQESEGTVVVLKKSDNGLAAVAVAERTVGVDMELVVSRYDCWHTQRQAASSNRPWPWNLYVLECPGVQALGPGPSQDSPGWKCKRKSSRFDRLAPPDVVACGNICARADASDAIPTLRKAKRATRAQRNRQTRDGPRPGWARGLFRKGELVVGLVEAVLALDCSSVALDAILLGLDSGLGVSNAFVQRLRVGERGVGFL